MMPPPLAEDVFEQWTDFVTATVLRQTGEIILVGHSAGAVIVSAVAQSVPDRIAHAVYVAGYTLCNGEGLADVTAASDAVLGAIRETADPALVGIDADLARDVFYNRCEPDLVSWAASRLRPTPLQPTTAPLKLDEDRYGIVPRSYVAAVHDHALPLALQREAQSRWRFRRIWTLDSDHSQFLSTPRELADALLDTADAS